MAATVRGYGFLALFVLMALESSMVLAFLPGEAVVASAAALLARDAPSLALVVLVASLGATAGSLLLYLVARHGHRVLPRSARIEAWFARPRGERIVLWLRMVPVLRALVSVPAGLARMDPVRFTTYTLVGSLAFNAALALAASGIGASPLAALLYQNWGVAAGLAVVAIAGAYLWRPTRATRARAAAPSPSP
jgi:membrane protein DedA with SNARE-associated domain